MKIIIFHVNFLLFLKFSHGMLEGLYCGEDNCYDLLGLTRDSPKSDISKAYRNLAKKWHPDRHKKDKDEAASMFQKIATAYETLRDEESRSNYDYMLDHPEEYYSHYYRYYRRRVAPKVDIRVVIVVTITLISFIQYYSASNNYKSAIDYFATVPKYRIQAVEYCMKEGMMSRDGKNVKKKDKSKSKEELKEEEENMIKSVIREKIDIKGGYSKPTIYDTLWIQLFMFPYYLALYIIWYFKWFYRYNILKLEYTEEDKQYVIRRYMGLSQIKWEGLDDNEKEDMMRRELWIKENFQAYKKEKQDEMKEQMADSGRYKQYRRYMKKGGPGQMTFGPD
ncbi:hypothetical protein HELRODRAFT_188809 [Helobdella robusta]|uniref:J domain-containing protein n=1 Tax=Helobdella robusta TaxID=6412 RepID=T1FQD9_HELRO|nr:hypothetical protein HELRODRAFT_188809 [Helobdella robusta]ESO02691.1 hypothetical protein HELRODRAFT_188809 [Helobdella robusta]